MQDDLRALRTDDPRAFSLKRQFPIAHRTGSHDCEGISGHCPEFHSQFNWPRLTGIVRRSWCSEDERHTLFQQEDLTPCSRLPHPRPLALDQCRTFAHPIVLSRINFIHGIIHILMPYIVSCLNDPSKTPDTAKMDTFIIVSGLVSVYEDPGVH